jgi:hypothetical protein
VTLIVSSTLGHPNLHHAACDMNTNSSRSCTQSHQPFLTERPLHRLNHLTASLNSRSQSNPRPTAGRFHACHINRNHLGERSLLAKFRTNGHGQQPNLPSFRHHSWHFHDFHLNPRDMSSWFPPAMYIPILPRLAIGIGGASAD